MKASELMVGDLVKIGQRVVMIDSIIPDSKQVVNGGTFSVVYDDGEYEPIPLTEEIFKANGWMCSNGWFERNDVNFFIAKCVDKYKLCPIFHMKSFATIAYVHELQHALRLCGLSELADNFKIE